MQGKLCFSGVPGFNRYSLEGCSFYNYLIISIVNVNFGAMCVFIEAQK
jgi:hypothetical protein